MPPQQKSAGSVVVQFKQCPFPTRNQSRSCRSCSHGCHSATAAAAAAHPILHTRLGDTSLRACSSESVGLFLCSREQNFHGHPRNIWANNWSAMHAEHNNYAFFEQQKNFSYSTLFLNTPKLPDFCFCTHRSYAITHQRTHVGSATLCCSSASHTRASSACQLRLLPLTHCPKLCCFSPVVCDPPHNEAKWRKRLLNTIHMHTHIRTVVSRPATKNDDGGKLSPAAACLPLNTTLCAGAGAPMDARSQRRRRSL